MPRTDVEFRSLLASTDVDVLPDSAIVEDRGEYVVVRTPSNPGYHWGNFLLFRQPPQPGDRARWEAAFVAEFGSDRDYWHCSLCWEPSGAEGAAVAEFLDGGGYEADRAVALVARPDELVEHPRANRDVTVHVLDPDGDVDTWRELIDLQVAAREPAHAEAPYREFAAQRMADRRERFRAAMGRGWWPARARASWRRAAGSWSPPGDAASRRSTRSSRIAGRALPRGSCTPPVASRSIVSVPTTS